MYVREFDLYEQVALLSDDFCIEDAEDGDFGYYAWLNGGYLPNCYETAEEAYEAMLKVLKGD